MRTYVLALAILTLAACGGGDKDPQGGGPETGPATTQTKAKATARPDPKGRIAIQRLTVDPQQPSTNDAIKITPVVKGDAAETLYRWYINGLENVRYEDATLPARVARRGDRVEAEVVVRTADGAEASARTGELEIGNAPPAFTRTLSTVSGAALEGFRFAAEDPDGDSLEWSLEGAAPGYSISSTGIILTSPGRPPAGAYRMIIAVSDGQGGVAQYEASLNSEDPEEVEEATPVTKRVNVKDMSDADLAKWEEKESERLEKLDDAGWEDYAKKAEQKAAREESESSD